MIFRVLSLVTACAALLSAALAARGDNAPPAPAAWSGAAFPQPANWPLVVGASATSEALGPGVSYAHWRVTTSAGPLELSIATIDLRNPGVAFALGLHGNAIVGTGERLSAMADRLGAEVGINADYFDINGTNAPANAVVDSGKLLHEPDAAPVFSVSTWRAVQMGLLQWRASLDSAAGAHLDIARVNEWSDATELAELTPRFGGTQAYGATELVLTAGTLAGGYTIERIDQNLRTLDRLGPDQLAIAANGDAAEAIVGQFHPRDFVSLTTVSTPSLGTLALAVGGGPLLVSGGVIAAGPAPPAPEETDVRNPVTGAGVSADGATLWLIVVDGRDPERSIGLTRPEFASLFAALGATTAMAFDSGGSSEMVVRPLGDPQIVVANTPSDGRERSLSDGLFVINAAPTGPAVRLVLGPRPVPALLVGSSLRIQPWAVDANGHPLASGAVTFTAAPGTVAAIDEGGILSALSPGSVRVHAASAQATGDLDLDVISAVSGLRIEGADEPVPVRGRIRLSAVASTVTGDPVAFDLRAVHWRVADGPGKMLSDGTFVAGKTASRSTIVASLGPATASAMVLSGEHSIPLEPTGPSPDQWRYASRPEGILGTVDAAAAPDGSPALHLAYDFSTAGLTRAAYAETTLAIAGEPTAFALDIYGDGNDEWLRAGYETASGVNESLTIARHVNWRGWRTVRAPIPRQAVWPITLTRLYVVEPDKSATEHGSLWFGHLSAIYPGP